MNEFTIIFNARQVVKKQASELADSPISRGRAISRTIGHVEGIFAARGWNDKTLFTFTDWAEKFI